MKRLILLVFVMLAVSASAAVAFEPGDRVTYVTGTTTRTGTLLVETPTLDLIARAGTTSTQDQVPPSVVRPVVTPTPTPTPTATPTPTPEPTATPTPEPTPTPTPDPNPTPGLCPQVMPNQPDGPDPWGGCWPGPASTGYPHGLPGDTRTPVTLTDYTPPTYITSCGVVLDKRHILGDLLLQAGNGSHDPNKPCLTVTNSKVDGLIYGETPDDGPIVVKDTEINPGTDSWAWWENLGRGNWFAWRVDSHGSEIVLKCGGYCEAHDSYTHGGYLTGSYHYNALGGNGIERADGFFRIDHVWAECGHWENVGAVTDGGCSSDIGFYGDFAPIHDVTINRTFFSGLDEQAAHQHGVPYCLQSGYNPGKAYPTPTNMTFTDNVFGRGDYNVCGRYGPATPVGPGAGITWSGNRYTDGATIARP